MLKGVKNMNIMNNNQFCFYGNKIAIEHNQEDKLHRLIIFKTNPFLNYWFNQDKKYIAVLDYFINEETVNIDYINVNDEENLSYGKEKLSRSESKELVQSMVQYVKNIANKENKSKILLDVHYNLRIYNRDFKDIGFSINKQKM